MIKFNEQFSFEKDRYSWQLHEWKDGKDKNDKPIRSKKTTYHTTLTQVCDVIVDRSCGACESLDEIKNLIKDTHENLVTCINSISAGG
jgi:hypothetical protein